LNPLKDYTPECGGTACFASLRLDMAPVTWHDHEMQSMSVRPQRRSVGGGLYPSAPVVPLAGLLFLASAAGSFVTGHTLVVDGGTMAGVVLQKDD